MDNQAIGIFDSGVGGLSIVSSLLRFLPNESFLYLADSKNCPYGIKSNQEIYRLAKKMVDFLLAQKIKLLVVACNTITVTSIAKLRSAYPNLPIVGIVPVIKTAVEKTNNKKIGIFSTVATFKSRYQQDLIAKFAKGYAVTNVGSADLVALIEKLDFKTIDKTLGRELQVFKDNKIDTLALGCSHFSLIKDRIQKKLPRVAILESSDAISRQVRRILESNKTLSKSAKSHYIFYTTGDLSAIEYFVNKLTSKGKIERISLR